jgi:hypothetical protein
MKPRTMYGTSRSNSWLLKKLYFRFISPKFFSVLKKLVKVIGHVLALDGLTPPLALTRGF